MNSTEILGVRVDNVDYDEAVVRIGKMISEPGFHLVTTVNPEIIIRSQKDKEFKEILNKADLAVADGAGLLLASKILKRPLANRVTGTDLIEKLCSYGEKQGWRFFFLGGKGGVAEKSSKLLRIRYPDLKISGTFEGRGDTGGDSETVAQIKAAGPIEIILVAYGHPKQEKWLQRNSSQIDARVGIGIGGAFDFLSGQKTRAPKWLRQRGLEWSYRLLIQPWRWRRQLALPQFLFMVFKERFQGR